MADANQQNLLLQIDANVELLRRSLNDGQRQIDQFERRTNQAAGGVDAAFGKMQRGGVVALSALSGAIAGFGVVGLAELGRGILNFADDLATAADQANVNVERYQRLVGGLRALELSTDQTDKVLKRLSSTLGEVQGGTAAKGVTDALDRMGVTTRILNGEIDTTDELLDAIAASAKNFKTEAEFTAAVVDILGRKIGVDFAAAVRDGGLALAEAEAQVTAATEAQINALAAANEAIDKFTEDTKNKFTIWAGSLLLNIDRVNRNLEILGANPGRDAAEASADNIVGLGFGRTRDTGRRNLPKGGLGSGRAASGSAFRLRETSAPIPVPRRPASGASATTRRARASGGSAGATSRSLSPAELREAGIASPGISLGDTPVAGADRLLQTMLEIRDVTAEIEASKLANSLEAAQGFGRDISANLAQAIVYGQDIGDALVASFKAAAAEALANGLFELLLGKNGQGGVLSSLITAAGTAFGGARANGGSVSAGSAYLVGERGPELFIPRASGRIAPNGSFGGGGGAVINVDARGATDPMAVEMAARRGAAMALAQVSDAARQSRRPGLSRGLG